MTDEYINKDIAWPYFKRAQCVKDRKELVDLFNKIPSINIQKLLNRKALKYEKRKSWYY